MILLGCFSFPKSSAAQDFAVKTNLTKWATVIPNIGVDIGFAPKWSIDLSTSGSPIALGDVDRKLIGAQFETRYWLRQRFSSHFVGFHSLYHNFDWVESDFRYRGNIVGGGLSYGYSWLLSKRLSLEGNIGAGYSYIFYGNEVKESAENSLELFPSKDEGYWGITRLGINIVYLF